MLFDSDDVVIVAGRHPRRGSSTSGPVSARDEIVAVPDPVFNVDGINTRRVEPRNAPTVINAIFTVEQFWDGRGKFWFNGVNEHGLLDENARILVRQEAGADRCGGQGQGRDRHGEPRVAGACAPAERLRDVGRRPHLAQDRQEDAQACGRSANRWCIRKTACSAPSSRDDGTLTRPGLKTTYRTMIRKAFNRKYWYSNRLFDAQQNEIGQGKPSNTGEYTLMEMNFSLFFGLAIQLYEGTLISDDSPFDHFMAGDRSAMTAEEQLGMDLFVNQLPCINCHKLPEVTKATVEHMIEFPIGIDSIIERMRAAEGGANGCQDCAPLYDGGFYNVGARPLNEDLGRGETFVIGEGANAIELPKAFTTFAMANGQAPLRIPIPQLKQAVRSNDKFFIDGAMRVPSLRNAELTGPYYHHGGLGTLFDVVQFYTRGSDFRDENLDVLDAGIGLTESVAILKGHPERQRAIAAFMARPLTDERVRYKRAPFDHPQIFIPHGHPGNENSVTDDGTGTATDQLIEVPAMGAKGQKTALTTFLRLTPTEPSP